VLKSTYLSLSRHNIYYFRWPIPRQFHPHGKTIYVKQSLETREPKKALRLAVILEYHAQRIISMEDTLTMTHDEIRAIIKAHLAKAMDEKKAAIHQNGPLKRDYIEVLLKTSKDAKTVIEGNYSEPWYGVIDKFIEPILVDHPTPSPQDYTTFKLIYAQAIRNWCEQLSQFTPGGAQVRRSDSAANFGQDTTKINQYQYQSLIQKINTFNIFPYHNLIYRL
jgi:hypothetical protein